MVEDLGEHLVVDLIELLEGVLHGFLVAAGDEVEILSEAIGGVVHQHLCVLEALGVASEIHVYQVGVVVDLLESGGGLVGVAIGDLFAGTLGHAVDDFGVEETLFAGAGLTGAQFKLSQEFGIGVVWTGCVQGWQAEGREEAERGDVQGRIESMCVTKEIAHESPRGDLVLSAGLRNRNALRYFACESSVILRRACDSSSGYFPPADARNCL